jgi:hypothetical protein
VDKDTAAYTLIRGRDFDATQPEDQVYCLLGLVQDHIRDKILPSPTYQSVSATYTNAAIAILEEGGGELLLLSCVEGEKFQLVKGLPSWVPDWSCPGPVGLRRTEYPLVAWSSSR